MTPLEKTVARITRGALDGFFGPDRGRRLVCAFEVGDLLTIRPAGTRRKETVSLLDVYRFAITRRVNCERLEKARSKKAGKAARLAELRITRAARRDLRRDAS